MPSSAAVSIGHNALSPLYFARFSSVEAPMKPIEVVPYDLAWPAQP
jgi:hypothetical protein